MSGFQVNVYNDAYEDLDGYNWKANCIFSCGEEATAYDVINMCARAMLTAGYSEEVIHREMVNYLLSEDVDIKGYYDAEERYLNGDCKEEE